MTRSRILDACVLIAAIALAFVLRAGLNGAIVFRGEHVVFAGTDAWIHMRNVDAAVANFPAVLWFDPYRLSQGGQWAEAPLMDLIIAAAALLAGGGEPSSRLVDIAGAFTPAVAGALVVLPVFFITRRLFGRPAAWIAAILIAVFPGQLFQRSLAGHTDHHVFEALLAASVLALLMRAIAARQPRDAGFAGIALGAYLWAWSGGGFLLVILIGAATVMIASRFADPARPLAIAFIVAAVVASPVALRLPAERLVLPLLLGGAAIVLLLERVRARPMLVAAAIALIAAGVALAISEDLLSYAKRFAPSEGALTIGEVRPLLQMDGRFSLAPVWGELTTSAVLAPIGLVLLFLAAWRTKAGEKALFVLWSGAIVAATLVQIRFGYYLAICAAVLASGAAVWLAARLNRIFAVVAVAAIVIYPNVPRAAILASMPNFGPSEAWFEAMEWMRTNTPEPFGRAGAYTTTFASPRSAPRASYGVIAWWPYGYWVTRLAHRAPVANPTQAGAKEAASFYLATSEEEAKRIASRTNAAYVVADDSMLMRVATSGLPHASQLVTMMPWAGVEASRYFEVHYANGRPLYVYHPDYYRTMAIHLAAQGGEAWTPRNSTWLIASREVLADGERRREITDARRFETWEAAQAFARDDPGRWTLAGLDPLQPCVRLPKLRFVSQIHESTRGGHVRLFVLTGREQRGRL